MRFVKIINVPHELSIENNKVYISTFSFLDSLLKNVSNDYYLELSFTGCKNISPSAALLLFSTVNYIHLKYGYERIVLQELAHGNTLTYDPYFSKSGLWEALSCKSIEDVENLVKNNNRFKTSCDPKIITNVTKILDKIPDLSTEHIFFLTLAMREAILNVVYHAYLDDNDLPNPDELGNRWWQCAWVSKKEKIVNVIIHDRGVGILGSYKKENFSDEELIKEAMVQGFSRSGLANRGMGSEDMKRPVDELHGDQTLTMYTGSYVYTYNLSSLEPRIDKRDAEVCGTLIHWKCSFGEI